MMHKIRRLLYLTVIAVILSGCLQSTQLVVPELLLEQLEGKWKQQDKPENRLTFYADETVKVIFPHHQPPIKLLTHLEAISDGVVLSFGSRWEQPAQVRYDESIDGLFLGFYSEDGKEMSEVRFVRFD